MYSELKADMPRQAQRVAGAQIRLMKDFGSAALVLLLAMGLSSCERNGALLTEPQYQAALVGEWEGNVGQDSESISFRANGSFSCQELPMGFINTTLDQGVTGTVGGAWTLQGKVITLSIDQARDEQPVNLATHSTIISFNQNKLVVKSDSGETSTFLRDM